MSPRAGLSGNGGETPADAAGLVVLASNENPLGASPKAIEAASQALREIHRYPESSCSELREALAGAYGLSPGHILVGNGSDELLRLFCEAFLGAGTEALASEHSFYRFRQLAGLRCASVRLVPETAFRQDLRAMALAAGPRTKAVYVVNPNNPTGTYCTRTELAELLETLPGDVLVLLDEAYHEFAREREDYPDTVPLWIERHPNLVVLRTFSKAYGLAGLRVGFCVAHPGTVAALETLRPAFNVNAPAQRAALAALSDYEFLGKTTALVRGERPRIELPLRAMGWPVVPSAGNFLLTECPLPGEDIARTLRGRGILVRPLNRYGLPRHLRITVGLPPQNRTLVRALESLADARTIPHGP